MQSDAHAKDYFPTEHHGVTLTHHKPMEFDKDIRRMSTHQKDRMKVLKKYLDFSLFKDPIYLVILISNAASSISYTNFIIFLPSYGVFRGMETGEAPYLISILSFFDLIGRLGASILSDYRLMPRYFYFVGGLVVSGGSLLIVPWMSSFVSIVVPSALFGLSSGALIGVTAIVMTDFLGGEKLTSTYGISLFVNGILQLFGPPLCAYLLGDTQNYTLLFVVLGVFVLVGAATWALMPFILHRKAKKQARPKPRK